MENYKEDYEKKTGINYGCAPCELLEDKSCKGAKPNSFYYPTECPSFTCHEELRSDEEEYFFDFDEGY